MMLSDSAPTLSHLNLHLHPHLQTLTHTYRKKINDLIDACGMYLN